MSLISSRNSSFENYINSKLSYTSRDYASILSDLIDAIPSVSAKWTTTDEADPGIVLVKLMAMLGDMLSYNLDKAALEVYPDTVTQRKNAAQIFRLIGYKMRWYKSATVQAYLSNVSALPATLPRFTKFTVSNGSITYSTYEQLELPANSSNTGNEYYTTLVEGEPVTPSLKGNSMLPEDLNDPWHSVYNYNVLASSLVDNRYYFPDYNVDQDHIILIDDDSTNNEWTLVENIATNNAAGKIFEFNVDEYDRPYIKLPGYWSEKFPYVTKFKLFYIRSSGENGEIIENTLTKISSTIYGTLSDGTTSNISSDILIANMASSYGYYPETPNEARDNAINYVGTLDTLITLDDFTNAANRIEGVGKAIATDRTTDPANTNMSSYLVKIYIVRDEAHTTVGEDGSTSSEAADEVFKLQVLSELQNYKILPLSIQVLLEESIEMYYWTASGTLYLNEPVPMDIANDLIVKVNNTLKNNFSADCVNFNTEINYMDVVNAILDCDNRMRYVDLDQIQYSIAARGMDGNDTGYAIQNRNKIVKRLTEDDDPIDTGYYYVGKANTVMDMSGKPTIYYVRSSGYITDMTDFYNTVDTDYRFFDINGETYLYNYKTGTIYTDDDGYSYYLQTQERIVYNGQDTGYKLVLNLDGTRKFVSDYGVEEGHTIDVPDGVNDWPEIIGPYGTHTGSHIDPSGHILDSHGSIASDKYGNVIKIVADRRALTGKYSQTYEANTLDNSYDLFTYKIKIGVGRNGMPDPTLGDNFIATPIKKGSVAIYCEGGMYLISDNTSGRLVCSQNLLDGMGTIDYDTGEIYFKTNFEITGDLEINFAKNVIGMARYMNLSPSTFKIDPSCIKKG